ncbi:flagellar export chaperone FliS [Marinomonas sp. 2405UD68-3]|uniref:flagellar export chaperone FliS n=1 Tax=Marinomonas sp. 2405UD68-3 TaxID=3391835 RepID=UPI0039C9ECDB
MYNPKVKNYQKEALKMRIAGADRYEVIQILMEGAIEKMVMAKVTIESKNAEAKSDFLSKASGILIGLRESLDFDIGGEIADNLYALYTYMVDRLIEANLKNDMAIVDEVINLMKEIKSAWDEIPHAVREKTLNENGIDSNAN